MQSQTIIFQQFQDKSLTHDSLLGMYQSNFFTLQMLIQYLFQRFDNSGSQIFLINKLYDIPPEELDQFVLELTYICQVKQSKYIVRLLKDISKTNIFLKLKIKWILFSFSEDEKLPLTLFQTPYEHDIYIIEEFTNNLIKLSLMLKTFKPEERKERLKFYIQRANQFLNHIKKSDLQGIIFPFAIDNCCSNLIVGLVENDCSCFNTKKRVPYRIVLETINPKDLQKFQPKNFKKDPSNYLTIQDFKYIDIKKFSDFIEVNDQQNKEIEEQMKDIVQSKKQRNYKELHKIVVSEEQNTNQWNKFKDIIHIAERKTQLQRTSIRKKSSIVPQPNPEQIKKIQKQIKKKIKHKLELIMLEAPHIEGELRQQSYQRNLHRFEIMFEKTELIRSQSEFQKAKKQKKDWLKLSIKNTNNGWKFYHIQKLCYPVRTYEFFEDAKIKYPTASLNINKVMERFNIRPALPSNSNDSTEKDFPRKISVWEEVWEDKIQVISQNSPYGHFPSYKLRQVIVKGGDDLRQEVIVMKIISKINSIFIQNNLNLYLRPYEIIVTSPNSGFLEFCTNTISLDGLKKKSQLKSLTSFYKKTFCDDFEEAQKNFIESFAAYSIVTYLLEVKDRHNGNMLIDNVGHIIHIDFGFIFGMSPGGINFENAPFKFTLEMAELMNGLNSDLYRYFKNLMIKGFQHLSRHIDEIMLIIDIMMDQSKLECFQYLDKNEFRDRFKENATEHELDNYVSNLIELSYDNWRTAQYDSFQKMTNNIHP